MSSKIKYWALRLIRSKKVMPPVYDYSKLLNKHIILSKANRLGGIFILGLGMIELYFGGLTWWNVIYTLWGVIYITLSIQSIKSLTSQINKCDNDRSVIRISNLIEIIYYNAVFNNVNPYLNIPDNSSVFMNITDALSSGGAITLFEKGYLKTRLSNYLSSIGQYQDTDVRFNNAYYMSLLIRENL